MTTEKFAESFKKNVSDAMKVFQDSTKAIIEAQGKQTGFANDIYAKSMEAFENINKNNFTNPLGTPEKIIETIQKNFESISNLLKATLKSAIEYGKQTNQTTFSKETIDKIIESYTKQVQDIAAFSQQYMDQFSTIKPFNSSLTEKLKKEFDANVELSKEQMRAMVNSYNKVTNPSVEAAQNFFNKLNEEVETSLNVNLKLWSKLINAYSAKAETRKNESDFFDKNYRGNGTPKKQEHKAYNK